MVDGTRMNNLVLVVFLLSNACFGTNATTCSWGAWSQWNCTCCGNSIDRTVFRVRTLCCPGTFACGNLRDLAKTITFKEADFLGEGQCFNDCTSDFDKYTTNKCSSVRPTKNQTLLLATPDLCGSVCIESLATTEPSLPSRSQSPITATADILSPTSVPPYSSHDPPPAKNVTTRPNVGSNRSLATTVPSLLPSRPQSPKTATADILSSTSVPPYSSHDTPPAKNVTTRPNVGSNRSLATTVPSLPSRPHSPIIATADILSSTSVPLYSSHDTPPAKNVTTRPNVGSHRTLSTTKSSLPSHQQPTKTTVTHRDSTRVTDADVRSSTHAPPYSSHDTIPAENVTSISSNKGDGNNIASRFTVSSGPVLWIAFVLTTVLCVLDLTPI